jgi:ABC-type antimicrobial peptide transport system permease subunit
LLLAYQSAFLALGQIWNNKFRSFLTTIGIVIGVTSVTAVVARDGIAAPFASSPSPDWVRDSVHIAPLPAAKAKAVAPIDPTAGRVLASGLSIRIRDRATGSQMNDPAVPPIAPHRPAQCYR